VFEGQFGEYTRKYGPEGATRAWFAGEQGMNNPRARDPLGTTVASYVQRFRTAYQQEGGSAGAGPSAAGPAATRPTAAAGSPPDYPNRPLAHGVNPDLMRVVDRAARDNPGLFGVPGEVEREGVVAGVRTQAQQREMIARGWSRTMASQHVSARALDLWPVNPKTGKLDADYEEGYGKIAAAMRKAAQDEGVAVQWGGDWKGFVDRPHWQLAPVTEGSGAARESGARYAAVTPATMTDATVADEGTNVVPLPRPRPPDGPTTEPAATTEPPPTTAAQRPPVAPPGQRARAIPAGATPMEIYAIEAIDKAAIDRAKLENEARKAAQAESKQRGEEGLKEAFTRADPNRPEGTPPLTREFVESIRPDISPAEYKGLLSALAPPEPDKVADHPDAILDLADKVDRTDPDEFMKDASAYVRQGKLKTETFRTMVNQNRSARKDDMPKSPYKSGYEFIDKTLNPGLFSDPTANSIARAAQANALAEYDVWSRANPNADYQRTMEAAQDIIRRTQIMPFSEIRLTLGRSRYFADKMPQQVTIDDVKKADAQLRQDILSGNLTPEQQAFEARRLNDWTRTIESEERLKLQQLQRQPSGQRRQQP
jgi:peptidoglycan L-alanyl-D-glutamate endopeptidase CwlK